MTFSIVARDENTGTIGVAAQSHFFALGPIVCWAEAGVGAIATQSFVDTTYGPLGLDLLRIGKSANEAMAMIRTGDDDPAVHQVAMVDAAGRTAGFTGERCIAHCGSIADDGVSAQGNMLASPGIPEAMVQAFGEANGDLPDRLLAALDAAQALGGDLRGSQSAALKVVAADRSDRPWDSVIADLRVDDHVEPLTEMRRLLTIRRAFDLLGNVMFAPGLLQGEDFYEPEPGMLDQALEDLDRAADLLAPNPEARFWRAVLLTRAGRDDEALVDLEAATRENPALVDFIGRVREAGFLGPRG